MASTMMYHTTNKKWSDEWHEDNDVFRNQIRNLDFLAAHMACGLLCVCVN